MARISHTHIKKKDFLSTLEPVCDMIEERLAKDKEVLVDCALSISRSATVMLAHGKIM